jgi:DNA-binding Xre family transcriptional regulator
MTGKLDYRWNLRQVMAGPGMFQTTDLIGPLADREVRLSSSQVYRLATERPERLSLKVLTALLDILESTMEDLIEPAAASKPARRRLRVGKSRRREPSAPKSADNGGRQPTASDFPGILDPIGAAVALLIGMDPGLSREAAAQAVRASPGQGRAAQAGRGARRRPRDPRRRPVTCPEGWRRPATCFAQGRLRRGLPACAGCGRQLRTLSRVSYDHRIIGGGDAARFLVAVKKRLEAADFESAVTAGGVL